MLCRLCDEFARTFGLPLGRLYRVHVLVGDRVCIRNPDGEGPRPRRGSRMTARRFALNFGANRQARLSELFIF